MALVFDTRSLAEDAAVLDLPVAVINTRTRPSWGVRTAITKSSSRRPRQLIHVIGNTIEAQNYGLYIVGRSTFPIRVLNNLLVDNSTAFDWDGSGTMTNDHNLYFGNSSNFSRYATGGSNRVTTDPGLSSDVPPIPAAGGSADQAGTSSYASSTDLWTNSRPAPPSIGAVEPR